MNNAIVVRDLLVRYGDVVALENMNLALPTGCITGLVGMNGSGKSTLFKSLMGMVPLSSGFVTINGVSPIQARKRGLISYVPQNEEVDWDFPVSVRDVVMMGRYGHQGISRRPSSKDKEIVNIALEKVELTSLADRQIGQLSGGQKKRVFVARGIAQNAQILLLDEPFSGVDKKTENTITRQLKQLSSEGKTILVSTHDLHALPGLAEQVILMLRRVLFHGTPDEALKPENLAMTFGLGMTPQGVIA